MKCNYELEKVLDSKYYPMSIDDAIDICQKELDEYNEYGVNLLYMELFSKSLRALKVCKALTEIDISNGEFAESLKEKLNEINKEDI